MYEDRDQFKKLKSCIELDSIGSIDDEKIF